MTCFLTGCGESSCAIERLKMIFRDDGLPWSTCEQFLKSLCRRVMGRPRLLKAMKEHSGMSAEDLKKHLAWGHQSHLSILTSWTARMDNIATAQQSMWIWTLLLPLS